MERGLRLRTHRECHENVPETATGPGVNQAPLSKATNHCAALDDGAGGEMARAERGTGAMGRYRTIGSACAYWQFRMFLFSVLAHERSQRARTNKVRARDERREAPELWVQDA